VRDHSSNTQDISERNTHEGQATMMTQARTQTLILVVTVLLAVTAAGQQLRGRLQGAEGERGASALEWAIIAAIAVAVAGVVGAKVIAAVNTHSAQIK
jgi:hypothetical protein